MRQTFKLFHVVNHIAVALLTLVITHACVAAESSQRPNIVFILADDLGSGDLGCYNADSKIPTPAFDELAASGMRFTDAHTPSSVCSPTRYGVLTGRYAWRSRLRDGVLWGYSRSLLEPDRLTVASLLKQHGYVTACVGKWHLGFQTPDLAANDLPAASAILPQDHPHSVDYSLPLSPGPNTVGFDYFFGIPASLDMEPYVFVENQRPLEQPTETIEKSEHRRQGGGGFWRGGPIAPSFKHTDVLPTITAKAIAWLDQQSADKPFFLYFPLTAPHTPWLPTDEFRGKSAVGYYGDFVTQVDWVVRQVMNSLDERGLADNTLLIVTSDNGSHWPVNDIEKWQHAANMHYRGQKADIWEGGHHVPFIARWPGKIKPASTCGQTICLTDLMATAAAVSDAKLPEDAGEDSFNLLPALLGEQLDTPIRDVTIHHSANGTFAIRAGDWKLVADNLGSGGFTAPRVVKPAPDGPGGQLYDMTKDPSETNNVWTEHPDIVERLTAQLASLRKSGRSRSR